MTITFYGCTFQNIPLRIISFILQSCNLPIAETIGIWANPFSLATTKGITIVFFSSGY